MFGVISKQLFILYAFITVGYLLGKTKAGKNANGQILSALLVNVFLPSKVFISLSTNFTVNYLSNNAVMIAVAVVLLLFLVLFSYFSSKKLTKNDYQQKVYRYSLTVSNYAYMGYAMAEAVFGALGLTSYIIFCLPFTLYTYTFGYSMLTNTKASIKRGILNPMMIAIILGSIVGLSGLTIPSLLGNLFSQSAGCASAVSMLLTGLTISTLPIKELFTEKKSYIFVALRLVLVPFIVGLTLKLTNFYTVLQVALLFTCLPCGLNPIVFAKLVGEDCKTSASIVVISHILSIITVPFWITVLL